jgi:hypothetical protein
MVRPAKRGYEVWMRLRVGLAVGFVVGYYLGSRAGSEQHEQIARALDSARRSGAVASAAGKARAVVDLGVERARDLTASRVGNGSGPAANGRA